MKEKKTYTDYSKMSEPSEILGEKKEEVLEETLANDDVVKKKIKKGSEKIDEYDVELTVKSLNVRKGPGKKFQITTTIKNGKNQTIIDKKEGPDGSWGKLANGGWISLDFVKKV